MKAVFYSACFLAKRTGGSRAERTFDYGEWRKSESQNSQAQIQAQGIDHEVGAVGGAGVVAVAGGTGTGRTGRTRTW